MNILEYNKVKEGYENASLSWVEYQKDSGVKDVLNATADTQKIIIEESEVPLKEACEKYKTKFEEFKETFLTIRNLIEKGLLDSDAENSDENEALIRKYLSEMESRVFYHLDSLDFCILKITNLRNEVISLRKYKEDRRTLILTIVVSILLSIISIIYSCHLDKSNDRDIERYRIESLTNDSIINSKLDIIHSEFANESTLKDTLKCESCIPQHKKEK